jgi:WD40 repeat protein
MDREPGSDLGSNRGSNLGGQASDAEARRRRLEALGALARQQQGTAPGVGDANPQDPPSATPATRAQSAPASAASRTIPAVAAARAAPRRGRRWLVVGAGTLGLVVIAAVVLHALLTPPARHAPSTTLTLDLTKGGIACPNSVAWSPDGSQVAVVGHTGSCPTPFDTQYTSAAVSLYNATTGKLERTIQPDDIIEPLIPIVIPSTGGPQGDVPSAGAVVALSGRPTRTISYQGIAWSPDGNSLGLPFSVYMQTTTQQGNQQNESLQVIASGVEVMRADGTNPQAFANTSDPASTMIWDLQTHTSAYLPSQPGNSFDSALPPAAGYHWASGTISADNPFSGPSPAEPSPGPVGNPDGGASFTLWQPGLSTYFATAFINGQQVDQNTGAFLAYTGFTAWSPDGRYLVALNENARLQPDGRGMPTAQALKDMQLDQLAVAPVRDKALQTVLTALLPLDQQGRQVEYAWRPDGRILAARQWPFQGLQASAVLLYDTTTGAPVATLTPTTKKNITLQGDNTLAWSPDGSHLLAVNAASGLVTIWGPGALPK